VDLVDQFAVELTAMPFVSVGTKAKAIAALKGFNEDDVKKARGSPRLMCHDFWRIDEDIDEDWRIE